MVPGPLPDARAAADAMKLATSAWWLWADSCFVIWSRSWMILSGAPGAQAESQRMVTEKIEASTELIMKALTGSLGTGMVAAQRGVDHFGRTVGANRRRLAQPGVAKAPARRKK